MKRIIVTPAGRQKYLRLLFLNLTNNKNIFDEWHLWLNTNNQDDIDYCAKLAKEYTWIRVIYLDVPYREGWTIHTFYKHCVDEDAIYLKLDDDIVFIQGLDKIFEFRLNNPQYFLVSGSVINNALCSYLYQHYGILDYSYGHVEFDCNDKVGWQNAYFAEYLHNQFLKNPDKFYNAFYNWDLNHIRFSINAIAWLGSDFKKFNGQVEIGDEVWLTTRYQKIIDKINCIYGGSTFVHFQFNVQKQHLETTNLLANYEAFCNDESSSYGE